MDTRFKKISDINKEGKKYKMNSSKLYTQFNLYRHLVPFPLFETSYASIVETSFPDFLFN